MAEALRMSTLAREVGTDFPSALTALGCAFEFTWNALAVPAGSSVFVRAALGPDKFLMLSHRRFSTSRSKGRYRAYSDAPAGAPGDPVLVQKVRTDSTLVSRVTGVHETGTDVTGLTPIVNEPVFGGGSGNAASGDDAKEDIIRIYPPGTVFTLELVNQGNNPADMHLRLYWWEVTADFLPPIIEV